MTKEGSNSLILVAIKPMYCPLMKSVFVGIFSASVTLGNSDLKKNIAVGHKTALLQKGKVVMQETGKQTPNPKLGYKLL